MFVEPGRGQGRVPGRRVAKLGISDANAFERPATWGVALALLLGSVLETKLVACPWRIWIQSPRTMLWSAGVTTASTGDSDDFSTAQDSGAGARESAVPQATAARHVTAATPGAPARGNYWEITFQALHQVFPNWILTKDALLRETGKTGVQVATSAAPAKPGVQVATSTPTRAVNLVNKTFDTCDVNHFDLKDSSFKGCSFINCRFIKANFEGVKFSGCRFERCHFLNVHFVRVQFIGCAFDGLTASGEQLYFNETSLSAHKFVDALVTNLTALPPAITEDFQKFRLLGTKTKVAGAIFRSVKDQPDLDQFFDATQTFELAVQRQQVAEARWIADANGLRPRPWWSRYIRWPARVVGLWLIRSAGFLTDWGRTPAKSAWLLAFAVVFFTGVYAGAFGQSIGVALLRALDNTFVFGYTPTYAALNRATLFDFVAFANALTGFCWYALLIPAITKRMFR